jgi:hypothetical protein
VSNLWFALFDFLCDIEDFVECGFIQFAPSPDPLTHLYGIDGDSTGAAFDEAPHDDNHTTDHSVEWYGQMANGDAITGLTGPVIKFEQPLLDPLGDEIPGDAPGASGHGFFRFSSTLGPTPIQVWEDALAVKAGSGELSVTSGDLTGVLPLCVVIPEPTSISMVLLGLGGLLLRRRK